MAARKCRFLSEFSQHYACSGSRGCVFNASGKCMFNLKFTPLFHYCSVHICFLKFQATMRDLEWMSKSQCNTDNSTIEGMHDAHAEL